MRKRPKRINVRRTPKARAFIFLKHYIMITKDKTKAQAIVKEQMQVIKELQKANKHLANALDLETKCKNQVYYFILGSPYFYEYVEYHKANPIEKF